MSIARHIEHTPVIDKFGEIVGHRIRIRGGFVIETFQQFVGAWVCRYRGVESGTVNARTERQGIAKCKAEILSIRRHRAQLSQVRALEAA